MQEMDFIEKKMAFWFSFLEIFEKEVILTLAHLQKKSSKWKSPWQQRVEP